MAMAVQFVAAMNPAMSESGMTTAATAGYGISVSFASYVLVSRPNIVMTTFPIANVATMTMVRWANWFIICGPGVMP